MTAMVTLAVAIASALVAIAVPVITWWYRQPVNLRGQRHVRRRRVGRAR